MDRCIDRDTLLRVEDGGIPADQLAALARHVAACAACAHLVDNQALLGAALAGATTSAEPLGACPDVEHLTLYGTPDADPALIEHAGDCVACTSRLAALAVDEALAAPLPAARLADARRLIDQQPQGVVPQSTRPWWRPLVELWPGVGSRPEFGLATLAALAFMAVIVLPQFTAVDPTQERGGRATGWVELVSPPAGAGVGSAPILRWRAVEGATRYEVTVVDASGTYFWQASTDDTAMGVPEAAGLVSGKSYRWWVSVLTRDARRSESGQLSFRVR